MLWPCAVQVSFYMRKGADLLSKWVGEAEKQLRLLFEEAARNQPAIIFFDEIDGLAPVSGSQQLCVICKQLRFTLDGF
jgi:SpoVK/Ycf46/Vps4 family AAA+-type ATPase